MGRFDDRIFALTSAKIAETAMKWFAENDGKPDAIRVKADVVANATEDGKAADRYIEQAGCEVRALIINRAREIAEEDVKRGEALL